MLQNLTNMLCYNTISQAVKMTKCTYLSSRYWTTNLFKGFKYCY